MNNRLRIGASLNRRTSQCLQSIGSRAPVAKRGISIVASRIKAKPVQSPVTREPQAPERPREDAYTIAEKAKKFLQRDNENGVIRLIKLNRDLNLTVTWNYLIKYYLAKGKVNAAVSAFNNMKKSQHFPNSHTYTTLLEGLARSFENGGRDKLQWTINTLLNDKRVTPSTFHMNAALNVCVKLKDLSLAYELLDRFQEAGVEEREAATYDTLFKLLRTAIVKEIQPGTGRKRAAQRILTPAARQCLDDALGIWKDVEDKWRSRHLTVDERLLYSYATTVQQGNVDDVREGLAAICTMCEVPLYKAPRSEEIVEDSKKVKIGNRVELAGHLTTAMLDLAENLDDPNLTQHYWSISKAVTREGMSAETYESRLRSLKVAGDPEEAIRLLNEMKTKNIEISSKTIFLALQCCFTKEKQEDLRRALKIINTYAAPKESTTLMTVPVITTFSRFLLHSRDNKDISTAVKILDTIDWKQVAANCQDVPHHKQHLRESLDRLSTTCKRLALTASGNKDLAILLHGFVRRTKAAQKEYYPEDYAARTEVRRPESRAERQSRSGSNVEEFVHSLVD